MLPTRKVANFPFNHADQSDKPAFTNSADLKAAFDSRSETMKAAHNGLIDDLTSVTPGSSGAEQIGSAPIAGVVGDTSHEQIADIKAQLNGAVAGQVPDGSLTQQKMSPDVQTAIVAGQLYAYKNMGGF